MAQNVATTSKIDEMVDQWIAEGRFANRSEAFRAGIFALKQKFDAETFDPDFVSIIRQLDQHPGGESEPTEADWKKISAIARKHRRQ